MIPADIWSNRRIPGVSVTPKRTLSATPPAAQLKHVNKAKVNSMATRRVCQVSDLKFALLILLFPSKIEWDLTNGPLSKLLELLDTQG